MIDKDALGLLKLTEAPESQMVEGGIVIKGTPELMDEAQAEENAISKKETEEREMALSSLFGHIIKTFRINKDHRQSTGINDVMFDAVRGYNGIYSAEERAIIEDEGGSDIWMNLTSTKVRAAMAWIKDILMAAKEFPASIEPTPAMELPEDFELAIKEKVAKEFEAMVAEQTQAQTAPPPQEGQPTPQAPPTTAETLKEMQERKRDLYDAVKEELNKEARFAFKIYEEKIVDSLLEGGWMKALGEVIDDFCIFPVAVMKGPIVTKKKKRTWVDGKPQVKEKIVLINKRISPFDIYPSPSTETPQEGDLIEYMSLERKEVANLRDVPKYRTEALERVLESDKGKYLSEVLDEHIDTERRSIELKFSYSAQRSENFHALHFFGTVPAKLLKEWGMEEANGLRDNDEVDVEAIVIGDEVVKCVINDDDLGHRPYYTASFQTRPGSFWGAAPPYQMRDIQRMCNGCARALATNMGLSSGPIMEVITDRLADGTEISELKPRDIIQTTADPAGGSGRAIQFFTIDSRAAELLTVYEKFEIKADDVTMIPRYAYGNERTAGAAATASGLAMLLESASKGIKDAIRHIDHGIIIPRIEAEFHHILMRDNDSTFTGDIQVIARGSDALTMKGAEQMRRNEFLQTTANPVDQEIMGMHGRAQILRKMADDLGLGENLIPGRQELKVLQTKKEEAAAAAAQQNDNVAIVEKQLQVQLQQSEMSAQVKLQELEAKREKDYADIQQRIAEMEQRREASSTKASSDLQKTQMNNMQKDTSDNKQVALSLQTDDKMN